MAWCACSMRSPSRASTAPASTTTGPSPPTRARTCSSPAPPPGRMPSSCCFWRPSSKVWTTTRTFSGPRWPSPATTTGWAPRRHRPPCSPSSWETSSPLWWTPSSTTRTSRAPASGRWRSAWTPCLPSARTIRIGTAPPPWPLPATSSSSGCWAHPSPSPAPISP